MEPAAAPPLVFPAPCTEEYHEGKPKFMFCTKHMLSGCLACMLEDHAAPPCVAVNLTKNPEALASVVAARRYLMDDLQQFNQAARTAPLGRGGETGGRRGGSQPHRGGWSGGGWSGVGFLPCRQGP